MTIGTTQGPARARIRRWRGIRSGWLVIEPTKIVIYRGRFMRRMEQAGEFETERLREVNPDTPTNSVSVIFDVPQGEPVVETFSFPDRRDAETVRSVLCGLLKAAEEEQRRRTEEALRLGREAAELRRQVRAEFAADVWQTAEAIWSLAKAGYAMESAVIAGDWNEARSEYSTIWQQADRLKQGHQIDLMIPLKELDQTMCTENGEEVIKKIGPLLKALGDSVLKTEPYWAKWRKEQIVPAAMSPNWNHLPFFLLFSAGHFETVLSSQIEDWNGVSNGLSVLGPSAAVLRQCFKVNLDGLIDAAESAGAARNAELSAETAGRIESALTASFNTRPFEYRDPVQEPDRGSDGLLPK
jgi:hypothetical protein